MLHHISQVAPGESSIHDAQITACTGKNPFCDPTATPETTGTYDVFFTKTGKHGLPNERKAEITGNPPIGLLVMRMYQVDNSRNESLDLIEPPTILWGKIRPDGSTTFEQTPPCSSERRTIFGIWQTWWVRGLLLFLLHTSTSLFGIC